MLLWIANVVQMADRKGSASDLVVCWWNSGFVRLVFPCPSDVCIGLRLQQVMKSQWQTKSLERSKPLKKLSLKHKLSSSKEKHKFTNSLMAVSEYKCWSSLWGCIHTATFSFQMQNFCTLLCCFGNSDADTDVRFLIGSCQLLCVLSWFGMHVSCDPLAEENRACITQKSLDTDC